MYWSSLVVQQVKNAALSLLWRKFDPWPGELLCAMDTAKKERKKKKVSKCIPNSQKVEAIQGFLVWHGKYVAK